MIDTGSEPNLIKRSALHPRYRIGDEEKLQLYGITEEAVPTMGSVGIPLYGTIIKFHVVPSNFPILTDGILGAHFLEEGAEISFSKRKILWKGIEIPFANTPHNERNLERNSNSKKIKSNTSTNTPPPTNATPTNSGEPSPKRTKSMATTPNTSISTKPKATTPNNSSSSKSKATTPNTSISTKSMATTPNTSISTKSKATTPNNSSSSKSKASTPNNSSSTKSNATTQNNSSSTKSKTATTKSPTSVSCGSAVMPKTGGHEHRVCTIEGRTAKVIQITTTGPEVGYLPRQELAPGVLVFDSLVKSAHGRTHVRVVNTTNDTVSFTVPNVKVQEIAELSDEPNITKPYHIFPIQNPRSHREREKEITDTINLDHLNDEEREHVERLIQENGDIFHLQGEKLCKTKIVEHTIPTKDDKPIHVKQYRYPPIHKEEINNQMKELLSSDIVSPSISPYNSPLWIVPKKPDENGNKRWRMVIDFRQLNEKTEPDAYPLPSIVEILDQLGSAKYFSTFDLASGFHQIGMGAEDARKTAFSTPYGHYEFNRMPFGLRNAPATFQRLMDSVLSGLQGTEMFVYLDDIVIYASSLSEHHSKFTKLAKRLRKANLKLQPSKCTFLRREVAYLGHIISDEGVKPCPNKISAVKEFPKPKNSKQVREFLGLAGYYRRFIDKFSHISKPLTSLLRKEAKFEWNLPQEKAFETLRTALCTEPVLNYPDFSKPFHITTDASNYAVGAILSQGEIGKDSPIAYASRLLHGAELNYATIEKECLAIIYAVQHFRSYIYGKQFNLITDHQPLVWMNSVKDPSSRLLRWRLKLAEYEYKILYKAGKTNTNADALSRNPIQTAIYPLTSDTTTSPLLFETQLPTSSPTSHDVSDEIDLSSPATTPTNIRYTRDRLIMKNDNLACFMTLTNDPLDEGATDLLKHGKLPKLTNATIGRAKVHVGKFTLIQLPVKQSLNHTATQEDIIESLRALRDAIIELNLSSVTISRTAIDDISWTIIRDALQELLEDTNVTLTICTNEIVIPIEEVRQDIIFENHTSAYAGHKGVTKTYRRIREKYYWPQMKTDVTNFVTSCRECQRNKLTRVKTRNPMVLTDTPGQAFDKIALDVVGPLPTTPSDHQYILTMQDLLTKYSIAVPLKTTSAAETADALVDHLICKFGTPKAILTDRGTNFVNALMRAVTRRFRIQHMKTTAFHPQTNGSLERSHLVLTEYLKQYINNKNDWNNWLQCAMFSYNTSVHEGTLYTPHELIFGHKARVPSAFSYETPVEDETYASYLQKLETKLTESRAIAAANLNIAKQKSKRYYDRKLNTKEFSEGDLVYLLREPTKGKFDKQYSGPHRVSRVLDNHNVRLTLDTGRERTVHKNKIKLAKTTAPSMSPHPA
ncbi:Retrovirus-related Pol polyprotein from transposon 412 [Anthophora retusa]